MEITPVIIPVVIVAVAIIYLTFKDAHQCTEMIQSVHDRNINGIKRLLKDGHDVDCQDKKGWTPLCHAAQLGYNDVAMALLHEKSDPSRPLYIAAEYGHYVVVRSLLGHGADPNKDYMGQSALYIAVKNTQKNVINVLLQAKARTNVRYVS